MALAKLILFGCFAALLSTDSSTQSCVVTTHDVEGPFHIGEERSGVNFGEVPFRSRLIPEEYVGGEPILIWSGKLLDSRCCPLKGWEIDLWHAGDEATADNGGRNQIWGGGGAGSYSKEAPFWFRGRLLTGADGTFKFHTVVPPLYSGRPIRHFHVRIERGDTVIVTQIYFTNFATESGQAVRNIHSSQLATISEGTSSFDLVVNTDELGDCSYVPTIPTHPAPRPPVTAVRSCFSISNENTDDKYCENYCSQAWRIAQSDCGNECQRRCEADAACPCVTPTLKKSKASQRKRSKKRRSKTQRKQKRRKSCKRKCRL